jgi:diadenosine tetraphosphatase ApaH/serine/threonine PP2A family protein phosphatase
MNYTKEQLVDALQHEYDYLCHEDFDPDVDITLEEHLEWLNTLTLEELIEETSTDETFTLEEYMNIWNFMDDYNS